MRIQSVLTVIALMFTMSMLYSTEHRKEINEHFKRRRIHDQFAGFAMGYGVGFLAGVVIGTPAIDKLHENIKNNVDATLVCPVFAGVLFGEMMSRRHELNALNLLDEDLKSRAFVENSRAFCCWAKGLGQGICCGFIGAQIALATQE